MTERLPDVAVIGGGIAGTATAAFLATAGASVTLFERSAIAAGASGRNSGIIQHPFDAVLAALYRGSLAEYRRLAAASEGAFDLPAEPAGLMFVGHDAGRAVAEAASWAAAWPATGPEVLDGRALTAVEPALAPDVIACRLSVGYPVEPAAATYSFGALARRAGATIVVGEAATTVVKGGRAVGVSVGGELHAAGAVVVAAGPWSADALGAARGWQPIRPVWGVVASVALPLAPRHGLEAIDIDVEPGVDDAAARGFVEASGEARDDLVDFSLVPATTSSALGSAFLHAEPDAGSWVDALRRVGARYVASVAAAPIVGLRSCARPVSRDGRPLVGRVPWAEDLWLIAGHGPWGISTGPGSARLLVDALLGNGGPAIPAELDVGRFGDG
jgi:D-hydroxyproline dehydrogenase subunit beta